MKVKYQHTRTGTSVNKWLFSDLTGLQLVTHALHRESFITPLWQRGGRVWMCEAVLLGCYSHDLVLCLICLIEEFLLSPLMPVSFTQLQIYFLCVALIAHANLHFSQTNQNYASVHWRTYQKVPSLSALCETCQVFFLESTETKSNIFFTPKLLLNAACSAEDGNRWAKAKFFFFYILKNDPSGVHCWHKLTFEVWGLYPKGCTQPEACK